MNDRELLELAAKAEGHTVEFDEASGLCFYDNRFTDLVWNPLHNDGDALRLAVQLRITIDQDWKTKVDVFWRIDYQQFTYHIDLIGEGAPDRQDATRRAIVYAAACIGRSML